MAVFAEDFFFLLNKLYQIFLLKLSLNLPTFYPWYSSQLVLCEQGVGEICLYFPLPPRDLITV